MDTQWYVRIRGQILGPFSVEKLQDLSRRGEFSRIHEVSQDGLNWERASAHPEFFPVAAISKSVGSAPQAAPASSAGQASLPDAQPSGGLPPPTASAANGRSAQMPPGLPSPLPAPSTLWYYIRDGKSVGPISETELRALLDAGQLSLNSLVWNERLPAWCPAQDALQHLAKATPPSQIRSADSASEILPDYICQTAMRIRSWTLFLTIIYWANAGFFLISGVTMIAVGSQRLTSDPLIGGGIGSLLQAIVWGIYAFVMYNYTSSLKSLPFNRNMLTFQKSLVELYHYFLVQGIVYIVLLVLLGIVGIVVLIILIAYGQEPLSLLSWG